MSATETAFTTVATLQHLTIEEYYYTANIANIHILFLEDQIGGLL